MPKFNFMDLLRPQDGKGSTGLGPDMPQSVGDRERGKFRPSRYPRLDQIAVTDDDGNPIGLDTEQVMSKVLDELAAAREWREVHGQEPAPVMLVSPAPILAKTVQVLKVIPAAGNYAAGDVVSESVTAETATAWKFPNIARAPGEAFVITSIHMRTVEAVVIMQPRCHFFRDDPRDSVLADNVARSIVLGDRDHYVGYVDLPVFADVGTISVTFNDDVRKQISPSPGSRDLYMILETLTAETNETAGMTIAVDLEVAYL